MDFGRKFLQRVRGNSDPAEGEEAVDQAVDPAWDFLDDQFALQQFENFPENTNYLAAGSAYGQGRSAWYAQSDAQQQSSSSRGAQAATAHENLEKPLGLQIRELWKRYKPKSFDEGDSRDVTRSPAGDSQATKERLSPRRGESLKLQQKRPILRRASSESGGGSERAIELTQSGSWKEDADKIKGKLKAAWNNMRYGWTIKHRSSFDEESPIWLLGKLYDARVDWTVFDPQTYDTIRAHKDIIRYFADSPSSPLSLHNMVHFGTSHHGKSLGEWYGPGSTALVLRDIMRSPGAKGDPILSQLAVYVAQDNTVCLEEIERLCATKHKTSFDANASTNPLEQNVGVETVGLVRGSSTEEVTELLAEKGLDAGSFVDDVTAHQEWKKSLIVIVPLRLGTERLNPIYVQHLRIVLAMRHCLGIIGGRPKGLQTN